MWICTTHNGSNRSVLGLNRLRSLLLNVTNKNTANKKTKTKKEKKKTKKKKEKKKTKKKTKKKKKKKKNFRRSRKNVRLQELEDMNTNEDGNSATAEAEKRAKAGLATSRSSVASQAMNMHGDAMEVEDFEAPYYSDEDTAGVEDNSGGGNEIPKTICARQSLSTLNFGMDPQKDAAFVYCRGSVGCTTSRRLKVMRRWDPLSLQYRDRRIIMGAPLDETRRKLQEAKKAAGQSRKQSQRKSARNQTVSGPTVVRRRLVRRH